MTMPSQNEAVRALLEHRTADPHGVRIVMLACDEPVDVGGNAHEVMSASSRRAIPATGIGTQSGRLLSS